MIGNPNNMLRDNHPLWRGFNDSKYQRPFMHGVVGPQWTPPVAELDNGFKHIASPMPKPDLVNRIIADDLPSVTYSQSSFDMPRRKDVIQVDIPQATIKTVEEHEDPRFEKKRPVERVHGVLYHGTGSSDPKVVTSHSFKQVDKAKLLRKEGVSHALNAERKADSVIEQITNNIGGTPEMILPVEMRNTKEHNHIKLHEDNNALKNRLEKLKKTSIGVRAAHTPRRLG
jgi:hypothetical protein